MTLGENHVCAMVTKPFETCDSCTKAAGGVPNGPKLPNAVFCCTSPAMPTMVRVTPPLTICRPIGSSPGEYRRTNAWLTMMTGGEPAPSDEANTASRSESAASKYLA